MTDLKELSNPDVKKWIFRPQLPGTLEGVHTDSEPPVQCPLLVARRTLQERASPRVADDEARATRGRARLISEPMSQSGSQAAAFFNLIAMMIDVRWGSLISSLPRQCAGGLSLMCGPVGRPRPDREWLDRSLLTLE